MLLVVSVYGIILLKGGGCKGVSEWTLAQPPTRSYGEGTLVQVSSERTSERPEKPGIDLAIP